jgi:hypothetical protein
MATDVLRAQLVELLAGEGAHMSLEEAVAGFPESGMNVRPPNVSYSPWQLLEHIRIAQADILDYIRNRSYRELSWPEGYWPAPDATATAEGWFATVAAIAADQQALHDLVADPATDLFAVIPGTPGHTILREVRVVADHTAYHVGEFAVLRQVMGTWPADRPA